MRSAIWAAFWAVSAAHQGALAFSLRASVAAAHTGARACGGGRLARPVALGGRCEARWGSAAVCSVVSLVSLTADEPRPSHLSRRASVLAFVCGGAGLLAAGPAHAVDAVIQESDALPPGARAPSPEQTQIIKDAIKAFDEKKLAKAEALFSQGIKTW
jgi:hypothetical protein